MTENKPVKTNNKKNNKKVKITPDELNDQMKLIESYIKDDKLNEAQAILSVLLEQHGENRALLKLVPLVNVCLKDFEGAYQATLQLTEEERNSQQIQNIIQASIVLLEFKEYTPQAETDVLRLLDAKLISEGEFYRVAQQLVGFKLGFGQEQISLDLDVLKDDQLLLKLLNLSAIRSAALAQAVALIRSKLLTFSLTEMELPDRLVGFAQALAMQAMNNEFAQAETEAEAGMISELQLMLEQVIDNEDFHPLQVEGLFLLLCMYRRLYDLPFKQKLLNLAKDVWPESLKNIVELNLYQHS